jgi:hypothetical protein
MGPPGADSDARLQPPIETLADGFHDLQHQQAHFSHRDCAIWPWFKNATGQHVTVPDGLDRFEPTAQCEIIKLGK